MVARAAPTVSIITSVALAVREATVLWWSSSRIAQATLVARAVHALAGSARRRSPRSARNHKPARIAYSTT